MDPISAETGKRVFTSEGEGSLFPQQQDLPECFMPIPSRSNLKSI